MFQDIDGTITYSYRPAQPSDYLVVTDEGRPALTESGFLPTLAEGGFAASEALQALPGASQPVTLSSAADLISEEDSFYLQLHFHLFQQHSHL